MRYTASQLQWHQLANFKEGFPAVILGKGPSVDDWILSGRSIPDEAVVIGVNDSCRIAPCHFTVTTHSGSSDIPTWRHPDWTPCVVGALPMPPKDFMPRSWKKPDTLDYWFLHCHGVEAMDQSREDIADSHWLFNATSSAQPAVHFAWYLGCSSLELVGIDGGEDYANAVGYPPSGCRDYNKLRSATIVAADRLFPKNWKHYVQA